MRFLYQVSASSCAPASFAAGGPKETQPKPAGGKTIKKGPLALWVVCCFQLWFLLAAECQNDSAVLGCAGSGSSDAVLHLVAPASPRLAGWFLSKKGWFLSKKGCAASCDGVLQGHRCRTMHSPMRVQLQCTICILPLEPHAPT
jgi:hypothetical protein